MNRYTYSGEEFDPDDITFDTAQREGSTTHKQPAAPHKNQGNRKPASVRNHHGDKDNFISKFVLFCQKKRTRVLLGIFISSLACYISAAALLSIGSSASDQSAIQSQSVEQLATTNEAIENATGPVGAKVSHLLIVSGFGLGSIVILVYMFIVGLALFGVKKCNFWTLTFKSLILAITISYVAGLLTMNSTAAIPPGGYHGRYLNMLLISNIGWVGAVIVSCTLVAIVITIYLNELASIYRKYRIKIRTLRDRRILENDRDRFVKERIADALSDTPMDSQPQTEKTETPVTSINSPTPIVSAFDIPSTEIGEDPGSIGNHKNTCDDQGRHSIGRQGITDNDPDSISPGFSINAADDIEQGNGMPTEVSTEGPYDPKAELSRYRMPGLDLLIDRPRKANSVDLTEQEENKERITKTLNDYGIAIQQIQATVGPTVTLYEIIPAEGVRIARIKRLEDDIAMSLAALGIRIIAPIPGKGTIGIEVPNKDPQTVSIRSILGSRAYQECKYQLPMALGATISNEVYIADLAKMPHLLVAGATGQGKSVGLNTIIASLLYKRHPSELKFVLVDPKMVEFSLYARLEKHYLAKLPDETEPVVTDPAKVVDTLNSLCVEMDDRYALLKDAGCRSLIEYNEKFVNRRLNPEKKHRYLPYIVMIVDEFADLIMVSGKSVETPIARIAQKARAVGMHMIIATQRPSTNVITGIIKANFPARIGFRVSQMVDSRTILDSPGANQLIGRGDMLISHNGSMDRVQCAFIDTPEVENICKFIDDQIGFEHAYLLPEPPAENNEPASASSISERDTLFEEVARWIVNGNTASTSSIQRRYSIGYNRAGKIIDQLEAAGVVGASQGSKPRQVLVSPIDLEQILASL